MRKLVLATTALLAVAVPAKADVFLYAQEAGFNGGNPLLIGSGALQPNGIAFSSESTAFGNYDITITGTQQAPPGPGGLMLDGNTINIQSLGTGTNSITISVVANGYNTPLGTPTYESSFTTNLLTGTSVAMSTDINSANSTMPGGVTLASFTAVAGDLTNVSLNPGATGAGPYALSENFTFTSSGVGQQANSTIDIASVPAPIVGAGLPGLLALFGPLGFGRVRRRVASWLASPEAAA